MNPTILIDSQTLKTYMYTRFGGNSKKKKKKISRQVAAILIIGGELKL